MLPRKEKVNMEKTYLSINEVNGYLICTMTEDLCKDHGLTYPCYYALTKQHALTTSPNYAVHIADAYDKIYQWCILQPNTKSYYSSFFILVSYNSGRNLTHDKLWFDTRDDAKAYAESRLDPDDLVSRYTIYDLTCEEVSA